mgnify:CR=1 FL=1
MEIVGKHLARFHHCRDDVVPEIVVGFASRIGDQFFTQGIGIEDVVTHGSKAQSRLAGNGLCAGLRLFFEAHDAAICINLHDAEAWRVFDRDRNAGNRRHRTLFNVKIDHLPNVHFVDVIGTEDQHVVGPLVLDHVVVLKNRVCCTAIPKFTHAHLGGHNCHEIRRAVSHRPRSLNVFHQGLCFVLGQHVKRANARVEHVGEDEVDDAVPAAEGDCRFGSVSG